MQNGLIEIANGGLALRERVTLLRRRRRVWTWLDWLGDVPEVPMENYYEILDLSGGKLHLALESAVLSYSFPSALEPTKYVLPPQCQELQVAPTMRVTSIAADESQDLIILLTYVFSMEDVTEGSNAAYSYYLLFKSPSTMTDHGDAHFSQLGLTANEVGEKGTLMLMKDHVALFSGDLLSIWNWKTGVKVTVSPLLSAYYLILSFFQSQSNTEHYTEALKSCVCHSQRRIGPRSTWHAVLRSSTPTRTSSAL